MQFESTDTSIRRVVIELPPDRAEALALALDKGITWHETDVEDELAALHAALNGR